MLTVIKETWRFQFVQLQLVNKMLIVVKLISIDLLYEYD